MPRGDGTGPMGFGPMTGRAAGRCAGFATPGFMNRPAGPGFGYGRGWRRMYWATGLPGWVRFGYGINPYGSLPQGFYPQVPGVTAGEETALLEQQAGFLEQQLEAIKARLKRLRGAKEGTEKSEDEEL